MFRFRFCRLRISLLGISDANIYTCALSVYSLGQQVPQARFRTRVWMTETNGALSRQDTYV